MAKNESLHPSVQEFKEFVKSHPLLVKEVRSGNKTWQDLFEEWIILGDNHANWEPYKKIMKEVPIESTEETKSQNSTESTEEKKADIKNDESSTSSGTSNAALGHLMGLIKNINLNDLQGHMSQLSGLLNNVQQLVGTFQGGSKQGQNGQSNQNGQNQQQPPQQYHDPFSFRGF